MGGLKPHSGSLLLNILHFLQKEPPPPLASRSLKKTILSILTIFQAAFVQRNIERKVKVQIQGQGRSDFGSNLFAGG